MSDRKGGWRFWCGMVVAGWFLGPSLWAGEPARVLVVPLENRTGDERWAWMGEALAEGIAAHFVTRGDCQVLRHPVRRQVFRTYGFSYPLALSLPSALWLAREARLTGIVHGVLTTAGAGRLSMVLRFYRPPPAAGVFSPWRATFEPAQVVSVAGHAADWLARVLQRLGMACSRQRDLVRGLDSGVLERLVRALARPDVEDRWTYLDRINSAYPDVPLVRWYQVQVALERGRADDAAALALDRWLAEWGAREAGQTPDWLMVRATWAYLKRDRARAIELLLSLSQQDAGAAVANNLGVVMAIQGRYRDARYYFERALARNAGAWTARWNQVLSLLLQGKGEEIKAWLPALWVRDLDGRIALFASWVARGAQDPAAQWLFRIAVHQGRAEWPSEFDSDLVHASWIWVFSRLPFWPGLRTPRLPTNDTASVQNPVWLDVETWHAWVRELVEQAPAAELDGLQGLVRALEWLEPAGFLHVVRAIWLARTGQCAAARKELEPVRRRSEAEAEVLRAYCRDTGK